MNEPTKGLITRGVITAAALILSNDKHDKEVNE